MTLEGYCPSQSGNSIDDRHAIDFTESLAGIRDGTSALHDFIHGIDTHLRVKGDNLNTRFPNLAQFVKGDKIEPKEVLKELKEVISETGLVDQSMTESLLKGLNFRDPISSYNIDELKTILSHGIVFFTQQKNLDLITEAIESKSGMDHAIIQRDKCSTCETMAQVAPDAMSGKRRPSVGTKRKMLDGGKPQVPKKPKILKATPKEVSVESQTKLINQALSWGFYDSEAKVDGYGDNLCQALTGSKTTSLKSFTTLSQGLKAEFKERFKEVMLKEIAGKTFQNPKVEIQEIAKGLLRDEYLKFFMEKSGDKGKLACEHYDAIKRASQEFSESTELDHPPFREGLREEIGAFQRKCDAFQQLQAGYANPFIDDFFNPMASYSEMINPERMRKNMFRILIEELSKQNAGGAVDFDQALLSAKARVKSVLDSSVAHKMNKMIKKMDRLEEILTVARNYRVQTYDQNNDNEVLGDGICYGTSLNYMIQNSEHLASRRHLMGDGSRARFTQALAGIASKKNAPECDRMLQKHGIVQNKKMHLQLQGLSDAAKEEFYDFFGQRPQKNENFVVYYYRALQNMFDNAIAGIYKLQFKNDLSIGACDSGGKLLDKLNTSSGKWLEGRLHMDSPPWLAALFVPDHAMVIGTTGSTPQDKRLIVLDPNFGKYHFPFTPEGGQAAEQLFDALIKHYESPLTVADVDLIN